MSFLSPPSPANSLDDSTIVKSASNSLSAATVTGIVSSITGLVIVVAIVIFCVIRLKRRDAEVAANSVSTQPPHTASPSAGTGRGSMVELTPTPAPTEHDCEAPLIQPISGPSHDPRGQLRGAPPRFGPHGFTYAQLSEATKHFSATELLGRGGSGSVYRGQLPHDGTLVAVKCIPENSNQGVKEFNAEVSIISDLRHHNLVKLKGWCHDQGKFLVVYDYMPNGSLDCLLFNDALCVKLNWARRYAVAIGLGSALMYLHNECSKVVIHRDVKSNNVLLDKGFVAKLGDFGLSRQVDPGATSHSTSVITGTRGYMAPEIFAGSGKATRKTDMYAFSAVLLEVVSGKRALDASLREYQGVLVDWVWDLFGQERELEAVDQRLGREWDSEEARRMLVVGLACSHPDAQSRVEIRRALDALNGTVVLPFVPPSKPPNFAHSRPIMSISEIMSQTSSTYIKQLAL